jgi:hypothetical protein
MCGGCGYARRVGRSLVVVLVVISRIGAVASVWGSRVCAEEVLDAAWCERYICIIRGWDVVIDIH